jgi:hypothetical protein
MNTIPKYEMRDVIDAIDLIKEPEYNVLKNGEIIFSTDDMNEAQQVCAKNNAVICGKGIIYFFSIIQS